MAAPFSKTDRFARRLVPLLALLLLLVLAACTTQPPLSNEVVPGTTQTPGANLEPGRIIRIEEFVIGLLAVSAVVSLVTQRMRIPYTIGLVIVGLALTLLGQRPTQTISPEVILSLLLPPLIFEAAFSIRYANLHRDLFLILMLAIPGVILTMLLVGVLVSLGAEISLTSALVFGALIAATDPISVTSLFRSVGAPKRLRLLLEGESLFNDGTSIVIFKLMLTIAVVEKFSLSSSILQFFLVAGGGIITGIVIGAVISLLIRRIDNYLVETTLTTVLAYGTYIIAETVFGVSGVLAVVAAGLTASQMVSQAMSPTSQIAVFNFWEYAAFLANSVVFLIIGLQTNLDLLLANIGTILWSILAVLVARAVVVYSLSFFKRRNIPDKWRSILFWGGLRGAVSLALVLSISWAFPDRAQLQAMTFGTVLFTLLVQGLTIYPLMRRSGILEFREGQQEYERRHARTTAMRAAYNRLHRLYQDGTIPEYVLQTIEPIIKDRIEEFAGEEETALIAKPSLRKEALASAWRETLQAQRNTLMSLYQDNIISEEVYFELVSEVDRMLTEQDSGWPEMDHESGNGNES